MDVAQQASETSKNQRNTSRVGAGNASLFGCSKKMVDVLLCGEAFLTALQSVSHMRTPNNSGILGFVFLLPTAWTQLLIKSAQTELYIHIIMYVCIYIYMQSKNLLGFEFSVLDLLIES